MRGREKQKEWETSDKEKQILMMKLQEVQMSQQQIKILVVNIPNECVWASVREEREKERFWGKKSAAEQEGSFYKRHSDTMITPSH